VSWTIAGHIRFTAREVRVMPSLRHGLLTAALLAFLSLTACHKESAPAPQQTAAGIEYKSLDRTTFNRRAVELFLPLFWREDANRNQVLEVDELAVLTRFPAADAKQWVAQGKFSSAFDQAYQRMVAGDAPPADAAEQQRHKLVLEELAQGRPTLVANDFRNASAADRNLVEHMLNVAAAVERIYARQKGVFGLQDKIDANDPASKALFHRNQSPFCEAPKTESDPACNALKETPARVTGLYPAEIQDDPKFCEALSKAPNAAELTSHFTVVVNGDKSGTFRTVPYTEAYREDMETIAKELEAAAQGLGPEEKALNAYLQAAAGSFRSNDWEPANAAWVAMNAQNSKWYVRIAPDEVYYDPCAWKAGFALQLARINPESIEYQRKLDPLKREMESTLAAMAGKPYKAREVNFKIPDFIDVVLNAGDQRSASGATVGQSLPNWGPVAESGGRTVAMTNLYTDADSQTQQSALMSSMFCKATNDVANTTPRESLIGSVLHEAAHNLGPSHEYKVNGKEDDEIFGGTLASTLEEFKAQTSALFLTDWLGSKGMFTAQEVRKINLRNIAWAFGHISRGMYAADGTPRNYSQLAAMQIGWFVQSNALSWRAEEMAANGQDQGCVEVDFAALPAAIKSLETAVLKIKGAGDKAGAEKLKAQFVDGKDQFAKLRDTIAERWLRAPKASFVYSVAF
jgi:hypothetical protein